MKFSLRTLLLICCLAAGLFAGLTLIERVIGPAFPRALLRTIEPGMTKQQVQAILGHSPSDANDDTWTYARSGNVGYVQVAFDRKGRVLFVNDESVFPPGD